MGRVALSLLLLATVPASASAQTMVSVHDDAAARAVFEAGRIAFRQGDYRMAARAFTHAYSMSPRPALLLDAGHAWLRVGERGRARRAYEAYLLARPSARDRAWIEARVSALARHEDTASRSRAPASESMIDRDDAPGPFDGRAWTWVAAGGSLALAAAAAYFWSDATHAYDALASSCGVDGTCTAAQVERVDTSVLFADLSLGASALSLAAAVLLYFVEAPDAGDPPATRERALSLRVPMEGTLELRGTL